MLHGQMSAWQLFPNHNFLYLSLVYVPNPRPAIEQLIQTLIDDICSHGKVYVATKLPSCGSLCKKKVWLKLVMLAVLMSLFKTAF